MKKLIVLFAVSLFALSAVVAVASGPADITMKAKMGNVSFPHAKHQAKISDCTECHHKGTDTPKCTGCHGAKDGVPDSKKAFHTQCKGCHTKAGGPTKCKECHVK